MDKVTEIMGELYRSQFAYKYKNYILLFIFYRYLSVKQQKLQNMKENIIKDEIKSELGYFIDEKYTWDNIISKIEDENTKTTIDDYNEIFTNFKKEVQDEIYDEIFDDIIFNINLNEIIDDTVETLDKFILITNEIKFEDPDENIGEIFEECIKQLGLQNRGVFYTPSEVSDLLAEIVTCDIKDKERPFKIYDPTVGSASLLNRVGRKHGGSNIKYFGQEINNNTYNLACMNLLINNIDPDNIKLNNADTLSDDWPCYIDYDGVNQPYTFDAVVSNPPYSMKWDNDASKLEDPRFSDYGKLAPKSRADYAFVLHSLYHLNETGTMAIILPHGVLFRGGAEEKIRKTLIEKNYLDTVIGLPSNLFYSTSIPVVILVFKKNRENKDIFFIDASEEYESFKRRNKLTSIDKIIDTYKNRCDIDKYSHLATIDEIKKNGYNLNIPRYINKFEEPLPVDIEDFLNEIENIEGKIKEIDAKLEQYNKELNIF